MSILRPSGSVFSAIVLQICLMWTSPAAAVNLSPQVDLNGSAPGTNTTATFTEDGGAVALCPSALVSDDGSISALTLTMTPHPEGMDEVLAAVPLAGLAVTYNRGDGQMLINGSAPASVYQQVLRTLTYLNSSHTPTPTTRVISVAAFDGVSSSLACTIQVAIVPVNDKPVVDLNGALAGVNRTLTFVIGDGPVNIGPAATLADPDSPELNSMTLTLAARPNGASETLSATGAGGVSVSYNSSSGVLSLTGRALLTSYQNVLRSVTYNNSAVTPDMTTRTLTVSAIDTSGGSGSATAMIRISVVPINEVPVIDLNGPAPELDNRVRFVKNGAPTTVAPAALIIDDGTMLTSMTLKLIARPDGNAELLAATGFDGITPSYNASTGVLLLSGASSIANYQTVLRGVTYNNTSANPDLTTRTLTVTGWDTGGLGGSANVKISIALVNNPPSIDLNGPAAGVNRTATYYKGGGAVIIAPEADITDDDTQLTSMTVVLTARPNGSSEILNAVGGGGVSVSYSYSSGVLKLSGKANLATYLTALRSATYDNTAAAPDMTTRTLTVTGWDLGGKSGIASAKIKMSLPNRAPTGINPATMSIAENTAVGTIVGTMSAVDPDLPDDTHTFAFALPFANGGKFSVAGNAIKVASSINFETTQTITVTVKATDKGGLSFTRNIAVSVTNVNETPVNLKLTQNALHKKLVVNEAVVGLLSASDPDADATLSYAWTSPSNNAGGRFKIVGNQVRIANVALIKSEPQTDYPVSIRVTDQGGLTSRQDFTIRVTNQNAAAHWNTYR